MNEDTVKLLKAAMASNGNSEKKNTTVDSAGTGNQSTSKGR